MEKQFYQNKQYEQQLINTANEIAFKYLNYHIKENIQISMDTQQANIFVQENSIISFWIMYKFLTNEDLFIDFYTIATQLFYINKNNPYDKYYKKYIIQREIHIIKHINIFNTIKQGGN